MRFRFGCVVGIALKGKCVNAEGRIPPSLWHDPDAIWWPLTEAVTLVSPLRYRGRLGVFGTKIDPETPLRSETHPTVQKYLEHFGGER